MDQHVLGVELRRVTVRALVGPHLELRLGRRPVVLGREDPVAVAVVLGERAAFLPGGGAARDGQLPRVQPDAPPELLPVPLDARVADGDVGRLLADRELPGEIRGDAGYLGLVEAVGPRWIVVERRGLRAVRREAEEAMLLVEDAAAARRAGHRLVRVVGFGLVEVRVVRRVRARIRVGGWAGEDAPRARNEGRHAPHEEEREEDGVKTAHSASVPPRPMQS